MIEFFPKDMTQEEKDEFVRNIPIEMRFQALQLERIYGTSYIIKTKEDIYELYYYDTFKEDLVKYE